MIVANFTLDKLNWMHLGANGTIPAYDPDDPKKPHIVTFDDSRANFILNKSGIRGLVQMNFGDDEELKKAESLKLWRTFWERQIEMHNQHNEDQKEKGNRYSRPTDELDAHAKLLGLELLRPWRVEQKSNKETDELRGENIALKKSLEAMQAQMTEILRMMGSGKLQSQVQPQAPFDLKKPKEEDLGKKEDLEKVIEINRNKYKRLGENNMNLWVSKNWDDILIMPTENKVEIEEKYEKIYGVPFPAEKI